MPAIFVILDEVESCLWDLLCSARLHVSALQEILTRRAAVQAQWLVAEIAAHTPGRGIEDVRTAERFARNCSEDARGDELGELRGHTVVGGLERLDRRIEGIDVARQDQLTDALVNGAADLFVRAPAIELGEKLDGPIRALAGGLDHRCKTGDEWRCVR